MNPSRENPDKLSSDEWIAVAEEHLSLAVSTLDEARLLANHNRWRGYLNRLYYACFYGANALLARRELSLKTHRGTLTLFAKHYVKNGPFPRNEAKTLRELFDIRNRSDYEAFFDLDPEEVKPLLAEAETFLEICEELLRSS